MKSTEELIARLRDRDNVHDGDVDEAADRLEELIAERAAMVAALKKRRQGDREDGFTSRFTAACFGISRVTLSKWTSDDPTTEPDFVD